MPSLGMRMRQLGSAPWYVAGICCGAVLILVAAARQPLDWDEYMQAGPYGSDSLSTMVGGTRQPPLDPLAGGIIQHLFGVGRFQDHLGSALAGIGVLIVFALLMRALKLGAGGAIALWALATAPLMVRYSAYGRPYAMPLFEMLLFAYATQRWLQAGRRRHLLLAAVAAVSMPLTRVPEPCSFLVVAAVALGFLAWRGRYRWSQVAAPLALALGSVIVIGIPLVLKLQHEIKGTAVVSTHPLETLQSGPPHLHELVSGVPGLFATWLSWWPLTVALLLVLLLVPQVRRRWTHWWFVLPLLAAPLAFLLAFHLFVTKSFLGYQPRHAYFWVLPVAIGFAAVAAVATDHAVAPRLRRGLLVLVAAAIVTQLPTTALVLANSETPDWHQIAQVLTNELPDDAIVIFENPSHHHRAAFSAIYDESWDQASAPRVLPIDGIVSDPTVVSGQGPVYMLILESDCTRCDFPHRHSPPWDRNVAGWSLQRLDLFSLYSPQNGQSGRAGVLAAMTAFRGTLGAYRASALTVAEARVLRATGQDARAAALIHEMWTHLTSAQAKGVRAYAHSRGAWLAKPQPGVTRNSAR
jgi:hypothetical protein